MQVTRFDLLIKRAAPQSKKFEPLSAEKCVSLTDLCEYKMTTENWSRSLTES